MEAGTSLGAFLLLALAGAWHCAGMCGPLVALASGRDLTRGRRLLALALFTLGKAVGYAMLGVLAARGGQWLARGGAAWLGDGGAESALGRLRGVLALVAGLLLVGLGIRMLGLLPPSLAGSGRLARALSRPYRALLRTLQSLPLASRAFGFGAAASLLPCGLSWSALVLAATTTPLLAATGLFLFGLATLPGLAAGALGLSLLGPLLRQRLRPVLGLALVLFGLFTALRGGLLRPPGAEAALPPCCREDALIEPSR